MRPDVHHGRRIGHVERRGRRGADRGDGGAAAGRGGADEAAGRGAARQGVPGGTVAVLLARNGLHRPMTGHAAGIRRRGGEGLGASDEAEGGDGGRLGGEVGEGVAAGDGPTRSSIHGIHAIHASCACAGPRIGDGYIVEAATTSTASVVGVDRRRRQIQRRGGMATYHRHGWEYAVCWQNG